MDNRYRVIHDSRTERVEFIGNRYRVIRDPRIENVEVLD